MTTVEVVGNKPRLHCRDCPFSTMDAQAFSDHVEVCPVNPVTSHDYRDRVPKLEVVEPLEERVERADEGGRVY